MKLQDQVCTMEQGKKLLSIGITGQSYFQYFKASSHAGICISEIAVRHVWILTGNPYDREDIEFSPAFTVAELGVLLPSNTASYSPLGGKGKWWTDHKFIRHDVTDDSCLAPTEAESRAALLIHLLETNQITADEANKRLESHE